MRKLLRIKSERLDYTHGCNYCNKPVNTGTTLIKVVTDSKVIYLHKHCVTKFAGNILSEVKKIAD